MLKKIIEKHIKAILTVFQVQLRRGIGSVFAAPGVVTYTTEGKVAVLDFFQSSELIDVQALRIHLCADEVVFITIDLRTGRLNIRDTGDLAAAGRAPRFMVITNTLNENPTMLLDALVRLRFLVNVSSM